jgi:tRNA threonylcarbamoyladenosine biosynthesis protein TsaE
MIPAESRWITRSEEQTRDLGRRIGAALRGGELIALIGHLGAGKTQLVKGIAAGNQPEGHTEVTSPTFTLVQEYTGRLELYHLDCYRLRGCVEFEGLGTDEMLTERSAVIVEWADKVEQALPADRMTITISSLGDRDREFQAVALGPRSAACLQRVLSTG